MVHTFPWGWGAGTAASGPVAALTGTWHQALPPTDSHPHSGFLWGPGLGPASPAPPTVFTSHPATNTPCSVHKSPSYKHPLQCSQVTQLAPPPPPVFTSHPASPALPAVFTSHPASLEPLQCSQVTQLAQHPLQCSQVTQLARYHQQCSQVKGLLHSVEEIAQNQTGVQDVHAVTEFIQLVHSHCISHKWQGCTRCYFQAGMHQALSAGRDAPGVI